MNAHGLSPNAARNMATTIQRHDLKDSETKSYPGEHTFGNPRANRVDYQIPVSTTLTASNRENADD